MSVWWIPAIVAYYVVGVFVMRRELKPRDTFEGGIVVLEATIWPLWMLGKLVAA